MIFSNPNFIRITIFVLGLCGFFISKYIWNHKTKNTPLVCIRGFDCRAVLHSNYSKFIGMPNEFMGMIYYAFISLISILFILMQSSTPFALINFVTVLAFMAMLFSIYLIGVQIFIIKKACSWCIISTIISILIFAIIIFL